jgi:ankyrin repeat protein
MAAENDVVEELLVAFESDDYEKVKTLLHQRAELDINKLNDGGWTPLHFTAHSGDLELPKYLVQVRKADLNLRNNYGAMALMYASMNGHLDVCKFLSENDAELNCRDYAGRTELMFAADKGHLEICEFLVAGSKQNVNINSTDHDGIPH